MKQRREELEQRLIARIEALEARPSLKYHGVYNKDVEYNEGDFVTWGGSMWACKARTRTAPDLEGREFWQLAVKKGRDGRFKDGKYVAFAEEKS